MGRRSLGIVVLAILGSVAWSQELTGPEGIRPAVFDSRTGEKKPAVKKPGEKSPEAPATPAVDVPFEQLGKQFRLVGKLKQPLGELVKVQGMIVNGSGQRHEDGLHIRVFRINGQATQEFLQVKIRDYYGREEIPNLQPGYMCELEGFETGGFVGVPVAAVKRGGALAQTSRYHFLHEFKVIDSAESKLQPFAPADFLGRDMLVQGQAVTENGSAYIAGNKWKLLIDNGTPWPRNTDGKTVEARGIVQTIGKSTTYRLENSGKANNARLVHLQDQLNKPVVLRGVVVEKNGEYSFRYRGQQLHVDGLQDLVAQTGLRGEAQLTGTLDMVRITVDSADSFNGERITRTEYIVRKPALKPTDPLLAIERAEPVE
jgi:hypothetical protein